MMLWVMVMRLMSGHVGVDVDDDGDISIINIHTNMTRFIRMHMRHISNVHLNIIRTSNIRRQFLLVYKLFPYDSN